MTVAPPPGVGQGQGEQAPDGSWRDMYTKLPLTQSPDGTLTNTATGQTYGPDGTLRGAPNLQMQTAGNAAQKQAFLDSLNGDAARGTTAFNGQQGLAANLNDAINNPQHSSVAAAQLGASLDDTNRTQLAAASGVGGQNAFAAKRGAMANIGLASSQQAQSAALLRAKETADATSALGGVYNSMAGAAGQKYGQDLSGAGEFGKLSADGALANEQGTAKAKQDSINDKVGLINGIGGGFGSMAKGGG